MAISRFVFHSISNLLARKKIFLTKSLSFRSKSQSLPANFDYIRYSTLGLCYEEIIANNVKGNIAELGVYKGDFAKRLNSLFSGRLLYLFDTFDGFDDKDIIADSSQNYSNGEQDFSNTSVDLVMSKMPFPKNCIIRKGVFPETAKDITDTFCFVSIDPDLYNPIYKGLNFFYPKLEKGGYIFIHDFNNEEYKGARQAVLKFCKENNINFVPIPDSGGTAIITK